MKGVDAFHLEARDLEDDEIEFFVDVIGPRPFVPPSAITGHGNLRQMNASSTSPMTFTPAFAALSSAAKFGTPGDTTTRSAFGNSALLVDPPRTSAPRDFRSCAT
jgi:hypothetical protein